MAIGLTPIAPTEGQDGGPVNKSQVFRLITNEELEEAKDRGEENKPTQPPASPAAQHVRTFFQAAKEARVTVEQKMLSILRQIKGEYDPEKLKAIKEMGGSDDFIRLTQHKVRDTEAWIVDIINPYGDKTWDIEPTPIPDIPEEVERNIRAKVRQRLMQAAVASAASQGAEFNTAMLVGEMEQVEKLVAKKVKKRVRDIAMKKAVNMRRKILDQLEEGGWDAAFRACINDLSRLKACILKGPVYRRVKTLKWETDESGRSIPMTTVEVKPTFNRVSPFDWFPAPKSSDVHKWDVIEMEHLTPNDLEEIMDLPGYRTEVIKSILADMPSGYKEYTGVGTERDDLEKDSSTSVTGGVDVTYDMLNYWGRVRGDILIREGVTGDAVNKIDPDKYYNVNIKTIADRVIKDPTINPDPLGQKPYSVTSFIKNNDSLWGECPAELMTDIQSICNATVRALVNNIAIASGPIVEEDADRLAPGESGRIWPWKRILTTNKKMQTGPAIRYYQARLLAGELLATYEKFKKEADDLVVPAYGRTDVGGAGRTSSGLAMLMSAAARNIKLAIHNIDQDITLPTIQRLFNFNMMMLEDDSVKGDIRIRAKGTAGVIAKEQLAIRRNEFRATLRPTDEQILGMKGLAYILRKNIEGLEMDVDKAMPAYEDMEELEDSTPPPMPGGPQAPAMPRRPVTNMMGQNVGGEKETSFFRDMGRKVPGEESEQRAIEGNYAPEQSE